MYLMALSMRLPSTCFKCIRRQANLGMLGLGITEPLPSWGSLLGELQSYAALTGQFSQFVTLILFVAVVGSFHLVLRKEELSV